MEEQILDCLDVNSAVYREAIMAEDRLETYKLMAMRCAPAKRMRANGEAKYMRRTWSKLLDTDLAYSPNLTLVHEDFSLR